MKQDAIFSFGKIIGLPHLLAAARHNKRFDQLERGSRNHVDPTRSYLNTVLTGPNTPNEVLRLANEAINKAGKKLRKGGVSAIEFVWSLHKESGVDELAYFQFCVTWLGGIYGAANILSADVHFDESSPHMHILLLPMINGCMRGSDLVGLKAWALLRSRFMSEVAEVHGLRAPPQRLTNLAKINAEQKILQELQARDDPILRSAIWSINRQMIRQNPIPYMQAMGIDIELDGVAPAKPKTFAQIMTSTGKRTSEDQSKSR